MITLILCLRPLRVPKFIWFKILRDRRYEFGIEMIKNENKQKVLRRACETGNIAQVKWAMKNSTLNIRLPFRTACKNNHHEIVKFLKPLYRTFSGSFITACKAGAMEVVKLLMPNADLRSRLLGLGMLGIAPDVDETYMRGFIFLGACFGGHLDLVKELNEKGVHNEVNGLNYACKKNQVQVVEYLISKNIQPREYEAFKGGNPQIIKMVQVALGDNFHGYHAFCGAVNGGHLELVKMYAPYAVNRSKIGYIGNNMEILLFCHELGVLNYEESLFHAVKRKYKNVINFLVNHVSYFTHALMAAEYIGSAKLYKFFMKLQNKN